MHNRADGTREITPLCDAALARASAKRGAKSYVHVRPAGVLYKGRRVLSLALPATSTFRHDRTSCRRTYSRSRSRASQRCAPRACIDNRDKCDRAYPPSFPVSIKPLSYNCMASLETYEKIFSHAIERYYITFKSKIGIIYQQKSMITFVQVCIENTFPESGPSGHFSKIHRNIRSIAIISFIESLERR